MPIFDFNRARRSIQNTRPGQERNMYGHLRDLFVHLLGHASDNVYTDTPQEGGGVPDLTIKCDTGLADAKERAIYHDWIVVEAKAGRGVFLDENKKDEIFAEKQKYIQPETEWFVMADPECVVVRPVSVRNKISVAQDIVVRWEDFADGKDFCKKLRVLSFEGSDSSPALKAFREGDESRIAVVHVDAPQKKRARMLDDERARMALAKKDFLKAIRFGVSMLQGACKQALEEWHGEIKELQQEYEAFDKRWEAAPNSELLFTPQIKGKKIESSEDKEEHDEQALRLNRKIGKNLVVARLALHALPAHRKRNDKNTDEIFAIETASQLLARILLLRFFEDHNFFGNEKYVCNGGVKELQGFIRRSGKGYAFVAREAYERGGEVCDEAFEENHLDWVLSSKNEHVSRAIEMTMMLLSRFNFSTVSGDILTGIYDRFLDKEQRKEQGEFYTPPSVARYIVQRLNIRAEDSVFDPACGSGTFLLEAFEQMTRGDIRDGRGNYAQAEAALSRIGGNDLNPFSAMMARIQILWHLLPLKQDLKTRGFPNIRVSGGIDAIAQQGEMRGEGDAYEYADLTRGSHNAVVGNPPYVRPERSGEVDKETQAFYAEIGGASKNFYDLFVYKALARWCVKDKKRPGRLGFVLPLSFCDSDNSAPLRRLFEVGGRFCVLEIVDMEMISPLVFDAAVNPIVLLAENRPAKAEDKIILRIAGEECVLGDGEFDLSRATESKFDYEQVFANGNGKTKSNGNGNGNGKAEGGRRILTKLSKKRKRITDIMRREKQTLADIARHYYAGLDKRGKIKEWRDTPPEGALMEGGASNGILRWENRRMSGRGAVSRGKMQIAKKDGGGLDFYKGENVSSCLVEGEPAQANVLPDSLDDPSLWRFPHLLPGVGYAFLRIALGITGAKFNPHELAFMDTATLLIPNEEWEKFPLDIALTSRIYQFYYACYLRESAMSHSFRSHLYPRTLEKIPLPSALLAQSKKLGELREKFLDLCEKTNQRAVALVGFLQEASAGRLKDICRDNQLAIAWSDGLNKGREVKICAPTVDSIKAEGGRVLLDGEEWLEVKDPEVARGVAAALAVLHERELKKEHLQEMQTPINKNARAAFQEAARKYDKGGHADKLEGVMEEIDSIVGAAFGLSAADICQIQKEMKEDSFLSKIRPNLPFVERRRRGLSSKLASPTRYQRTTD